MTQTTTGTERQSLLPDGAELERQRTVEKQTYAAIGDRYGVSRQAVHKAILKWRERMARE